MQVLEKGQYSGGVAHITSASGIITTLTTYDRESFNGQLHYHENAHISFVLTGGCVEKKRTSYGCLPGKIHYYSAGEPHQVMQILQPSRRINVEIGETFFREHNISDPHIQTAIDTPDAKFLMLRIYRELAADDALSPVSIQMLLLQLVSRTRALHPMEGLPLWVRQVRTILNDRWNERISLSELALETQVHPVTISRYFSQYFSCTLGEYMRKIKIEKALGLMKSTCGSLSEIAYACGFADQSHFIRAFKECTGCLPTAYLRC